MIRKKLLILMSCVALCALLTGCGNMGDEVSDLTSKAGDTMSELGRDESGMMSRTESFLDGDSSHRESSDTVESDRGDVDSGDDGNIGSGTPYLEDEPDVSGEVSSRLS